MQFSICIIRPYALATSSFFEAHVAEMCMFFFIIIITIIIYYFDRKEHRRFSVARTPTARLPLLIRTSF